MSVFSNARCIVTHPGQAHLDEVMAVAFILAEEPDLPIYRRDVTPEDLADPTVLVLDQGGQYEPEMLNFDHHQMSALQVAAQVEVHVQGEGPLPPCATTLILRHLGLESQARDAVDWLDVLEVQDNCGPAKAANYLGIPMAAYNRTINPLAVGLLKQFSWIDILWLDGHTHNVLRSIGKGYLEYIRAYATRQRELLSRPQFELSDGSRVLDLRGLKDPTMGFEKYCQNHAARNASIIGSVSDDDRGPGLSLFRREGFLCDFNRLRGHPGIGFVHNSGFLCKTLWPLTDDEILDALNWAQIAPVAV